MQAIKAVVVVVVVVVIWLSELTKDSCKQSELLSTTQELGFNGL